MNITPLQNYVDQQAPPVFAVVMNQLDWFRYNYIVTDGSGLPQGALGLPLVGTNPAQRVSSSTSLVAIPEFTFATLLPGTYRFQGMLQFQGSVTGTQGIKFHILLGNAPFGSVTNIYSGIVNGSTVAPVLQTALSGNMAFATIATSITDFVVFDAAFKLNLAAGCALQFAQNTASANPVIVNDQSWVALTRLA